jgi:hypothetical protein
MIKLDKTSLDLLKKCISKHNPFLSSAIESNDYEYTEEFYNQLRELVGDELIAAGFDKDYEPNDYGKKLEMLIDEIGRLFMR